MTGPHAEIATAAGIAWTAHFGQMDKTGHPYIGHPSRVANRLDHADIEGRIVAWLHDVVEDTDVTLSALAEIFEPNIIRAVDAITRRDGEQSDGYYARVRANPTALRVKYADIADNTDPDRLALLDLPTRARLLAKYAHALDVLDA